MSRRSITRNKSNNNEGSKTRLEDEEKTIQMTLPYAGKPELQQKQF